MCTPLLKTPFMSLLLITAALSIMLVGGCPGPQEPSTPQPDEEESTTTTTTPSDNAPDRPIQQPELEETALGQPGVPTAGTSAGASGGQGATESGLVVVSVEQPAHALAVRPPTEVTVAFELVDLAGSVKGGQLLLAFDNDANGQPDGAPIYNPAIPVSAGSNTVKFKTQQAVGYLNNGFGRFVVGVRVSTIDGETATAYSAATVTIDSVKPTGSWISPKEDHLVSMDRTWTVQVKSKDNAPHTVRIMLDQDLDPNNGNWYELVEPTSFVAGEATHEFNEPLSIYPAGTYYYYVIISDGVDPPTTFYGNKVPAGNARLAITNRLIGEFLLEDLAQTPSHPSQSKGAILEGFMTNDLAGSTVAAVPDLNGDGADELLVSARFGKPHLSTPLTGRGWGEAYLVYGQPARLGGTQELNSVADVSGGMAGVNFRGVRIRNTQDDTLGLADVAVIDDMDGDDLPELVFSFPRAESVCLAETDPTIQHPDLIWDEDGMGDLEYNAYYGLPPSWHQNEAQFTRGGIVIVSSHNEMLQDNDTWTRLGDRVLDLHEIGQMFNFMVRASLAPYIRYVDLGDPANPPGGSYFVDDPNTPGCWDCEANEYTEGECTAGCGDCGGIPDNPEETEYEYVIRTWDVWLGGG